VYVTQCILCSKQSTVILVPSVWQVLIFASVQLSWLSYFKILHKGIFCTRYRNLHILVTLFLTKGHQVVFLYKISVWNYYGFSSLLAKCLGIKVGCMYPFPICHCFHKALFTLQHYEMRQETGLDSATTHPWVVSGGLYDSCQEDPQQVAFFRFCPTGYHQTVSKGAQTVGHTYKQYSVHVRQARASLHVLPDWCFTFGCQVGWFHRMYVIVILMSCTNSN